MKNFTIEPLDIESTLIIIICGAVLILSVVYREDNIAATIVGGFMGYLTKATLDTRHNNNDTIPQKVVDKIADEAKSYACKKMEEAGQVVNKHVADGLHKVEAVASETVGKKIDELKNEAMKKIEKK